MISLKTFTDSRKLRWWAENLDNYRAYDTEKGLRLKLSQDERIYWAGYKQEYLRWKLGIIIDQTLKDCIFLKGMTIKSFNDLHNQFEQKKAAEESRLAHQEIKQFKELLSEVNEIEVQLEFLGLEPTCADQFTEPYENYVLYGKAIEELKEWLDKLEIIKHSAKEVQEIICQFPKQCIKFDKACLKSDAGWTVSYNSSRLQEFARDLSLAENTVPKVEALYKVINQQLKQVGFCLSEDEEVTFVLPVSDNFKTNDQKCPFTEKELQFRFLRSSTPLQQVRRHGVYYDFSSIDALLIMRELTGKTEEGLNLRNPSEDSRTLGEQMGYIG